MKKLVPLQQDLKLKNLSRTCFGIKKLLPTFYFLLPDSEGQSMTEYLLVVFLVSFAVFQAVDTFGKALNVAFLQAINNIAINIR